MHVFGSMTQKVAVLVHGAALNGKVIAPKRRQSRLQSRRAIDDDKPGPYVDALCSASRNLNNSRHAVRYCPVSGLSSAACMRRGPIWCSWIGSKSFQRYA